MAANSTIGDDGRRRSFSPSQPRPLDLEKRRKKQLKEAYTQCLAEHAAGADACAPIAKAYLECRMDR